MRHGVKLFSQPDEHKYNQDWIGNRPVLAAYGPSSVFQHGGWLVANVLLTPKINLLNSLYLVLLLHGLRRAVHAIHLNRYIIR